jgi:Arc/MetJ-type ribon-helix-helix transcriptional regulator
MVKKSKESVAKESKSMNKHSNLVNEKISELLSTGQYKNQNEIIKKALQLVPMGEINKVLKDTEYEAVTIKPDKISFYRSQGCTSEYTEEQLKQIEEDANA